MHLASYVAPHYNTFVTVMTKHCICNIQQNMKPIIPIYGHSLLAIDNVNHITE